MYECIENIENIDVIHKSIDVLSSKSIGAYENCILASPSRDCMYFFISNRLENLAHNY